MEFRKKTLFKGKKYKIYKKSIKNIKSGKLGLFRISEVRFLFHSEGK